MARAYVTALREVMRGLGVSDVRMEQGSLRCDANVSLRRSPADPLGTRSETKNVNSLRSVERAVRHEICRQAALLLTPAHRVVQETRHWHEDTGTTTSGRSKEQAEDYRYFPEPDLVPVAPDREWVERLRAELPPPPWQRRRELQAEWGLADLEMQSLVNAGALELVRGDRRAPARPHDAARKWWMGELARHANERGTDLASLPMTPAQVARVVALVDGGTVNDKLARQVIEGVLAGEGEPDDVVAGAGAGGRERRGRAGRRRSTRRWPPTPTSPRRSAAARSRRPGAIVGAVMKATQGKADAGRVRELVLERCTG